MPHVIGTQGLSLDQLDGILNSNEHIALSPEAEQRVQASHEWLQRHLAASDTPIYGVNTGFGALADQRIDPKDLTTLQRNLVMSHACGTGEVIDRDLVRAMLVLKVQNMAFGHSAVSPALVKRLIDHYNLDVLPVIYERGSLGASGDLAPLAHLALPLIGEGEVISGGRRMATSLALQIVGWEPLQLGPKEGLALLNGTQFMSAHMALTLIRARRLADRADAIAALSLDAFDGRLEPFTASVHQVRPHPGQVRVAERMRKLLAGSALAGRAKTSVQDPYSFRCVPQVHGASRDAIAYAVAVIEREIGSVTDNPTVFPETGDIVSAGNFHGQPLAITLDFLAIALAELGSISERRTFKLISGQRDLPPFLVKDGGLNSGFMIPQYTAASLVSANKQRCTPASVDSIDSSNGQEDHVSMGANAALKCWHVLHDVEKILAIELLTAAQALDFRRPTRSSPLLEEMHADFRRIVPSLERDAVMQPMMDQAIAFVRTRRAPEA